MAALAQLAALQRKRLRPAGPTQTLEDVMGEMLRPMLQSWLDRTGPKLVESLVRPELRRTFNEGN